MYLVFKYICKKYLVFKYILSMYLVFEYKKVFSAQLCGPHHAFEHICAELAKCFSFLSYLLPSPYYANIISGDSPLTTPNNTHSLRGNQHYALFRHHSNQMHIPQKINRSWLSQLTQRKNILICVY